MLTRRLLLKKMAALGLGTMAAHAWPLNSNPLPKMLPSIPSCCGHFIIVGAGAAGLYAASQLKQAGATVTILEASHQHGGRIRPLSGFSNFTVELGAEIVHGSGNQNGNPPSFLYADIMNYNPNLLNLLNNEDTLISIDNTTVWDSEQNDPDINNYYNWADNAYLYSGADVPVAQYLQTQYGITPAHRAWHFYANWTGTEYGTDLSQMGMYSFAQQEDLWLTGENDYSLNESYLATLEALYFSNVLADIQYNKQVVSINYSGNQAVVTDQNGNAYLGNAVLITVPITVLRDGDINFTPTLPTNKVNAFNTIGMGPGMKIILKFSVPFWNVNQMYGLLLQGYTTECWVPGKMITGATNNILTCFIMGSRAAYMSEQGSNAINIALAELNQVFGGNAATNAFVDGYIMDWGTQPFVRGAYSFPTIGTYPTIGQSMRQILAQSVQNKLFFAGEATSNEHSSTVHGALESGARAALQVANAFPPNIPTTLNLSGNTTSCANSLQTYTVPIIAGSIYTWTINGGTILSGQGSNSIVVQWGSSGNGSVQVTQSY